MSEWVEFTIEQLGKVITGKTPSKDNPEEWGDVYNFITPSDYGVYNKLALSSIRKLSDTGYFKHKSRLIPANSLLVTCIGSDMGKVVKNVHPSFTNQQINSFIPNENLVNSDFIYYFFKSSESYLKNLGSDGSAVPILNKSTFQQIVIELPPFLEQQAISSVLSALDDKIDLLQRQNQTLEQMAATLFRQWFIEEAKEDWEDGCLGDIATNIRINADTQSIQDNEIYIGLEHIERRNIALSNHGYGSDVASNKSRFMKTDVLFGKLRPYFHKVCMAPFNGVCSTDILVLRAKQPAFKSFILFAFFQDDVVAFANLTSGGTRMPRADWKTLSEYPIAIPPMEKVLEFEALANPSISKIFDNLKQIQTLQTLRDTLLPKLISGEVRLKGFETLSEA